MKPFCELSRRTRLYRTRILAESALDAYGLNGAQLRFLQYSANIIYRVDLPGNPVALRGLLNRLWDLNLVVRSVQQFDPTTTSIMD